MNTDVLLRDVMEDDLLIFYSHQLDAEATEMAAFPARDRESFMAHWHRIMGDESVILKTILFNGQVAGNVVSWEQTGEREVGYWIGKQYWGKGIATRALGVFLSQVKARPLQAHVARHNSASQRVLEKCGFVKASEDVEEFVLRLV